MCGRMEGGKCQKLKFFGANCPFEILLHFILFIKQILITIVMEYFLD